MTKITDQIFIGNSSDADCFEEIKRNGITAVLNVAHDLNRSWDLDILSLKVGMTDNFCPLNKKALFLIIQILDFLVNTGEVVLVHCHNGVNRSPFVVAKYLAETQGTSWKDKFEEIRKLRSSIFTKPWMEECDVNC